MSTETRAVAPRGLFLCVEGIDGSGKTTQVARLAKKFSEKGEAVYVAHDPGSTPAGSALRTILLDKQIPLSPPVQLLLYTAARATLAEHIENALSRGVHVLLDRWVMSTYVYQGLLGGNPEETITALHKTYCQGLNPDAYVLLDVDIDIARERIRMLYGNKSNDRFESRGQDWWTNLRQGYLDVAAAQGISVVSGENYVEDVTKEILNVCRQSERCPHVIKF